MILDSLLARQRTKTGDMALFQAEELRQQLRDADNRLERLFDAVAEGIVDDTHGFRANLS